MRGILLSLLILTACESDTSVQTTSSAVYNIDVARISVSGLSSGAYMAGQFHVAYSSIISGAGLVAGGPYYCAQGELSRGLGSCMKGDGLDVKSLIAFAREAQSGGDIDDMQHLARDRVWLFHGTSDTVVGLEPTLAAAEFYRAVLAESVVTLVSDINVVHGMPTLDAGLPCDSFGAPFLNACEYDAAGAILESIYANLASRATTSGDLITVDQPDYEAAHMRPSAYLYVPRSCAVGEACGVHVAFHGCAQSSEFVADAFAQGAGFNEWAESNNLIIVYPQSGSSKFALVNPYGCWDWWGYTGQDYATRNGTQMKAVKSLLDLLAGKTL